MNTTLNGSKEIELLTFTRFTQLLETYGIPVICLFGIIGNIISFRVFVFMSFRKNCSSAYIAALSVSDSCFLLILFCNWFGNGRFGFYIGTSPIWCHVMIYVSNVCSFLSVWYVVLIMMDRYLVVCHSLRVPELCTKRRANAATLAITTFAWVFYSHSFATADFHGKQCYIKPKSSLLHTLYVFIYLDTALTFIVPFGIIFLLNTVVITSIKRFHTRHIQVNSRSVNIHHMSRLNTVSEAQMRITRTFTLVSIVMLVTNVPSHGIRFYVMITEVQHRDFVLFYAQQIFNIIYYTNFAVHFLLYSAANKKFRRYLPCKNIYHRLNRRQRQRENTHLYT